MSRVNTLLRLLLLIWVVGYLAVACGPMLDGNLLIGTFTLFGAIVFFVPWVIGIVVLLLLIRLTDVRRR